MKTMKNSRLLYIYIYIYIYKYIKYIIKLRVQRELGTSSNENEQLKNITDGIEDRDVQHPRKIWI